MSIDLLATFAKEGPDLVPAKNAAAGRSKKGE
jgi:hypothetical protein